MGQSVSIYTGKRINDDVTNSPCGLVLKHSTTLDGIHGTTQYSNFRFRDTG